MGLAFDDERQFLLSPRTAVTALPVSVVVYVLLCTLVLGDVVNVSLIKIRSQQQHSELLTLTLIIIIIVIILVLLLIKSFYHT